MATFDDRLIDQECAQYSQGERKGFKALGYMNSRYVRMLVMSGKHERLAAQAYLKGHRDLFLKHTRNAIKVRKRYCRGEPVDTYVGI